jgi:hypothetical protein
MKLDHKYRYKLFEEKQNKWGKFKAFMQAWVGLKILIKGMV